MSDAFKYDLETIKFDNKLTQQEAEKIVTDLVKARGYGHWKANQLMIGGRATDAFIDLTKREDLLSPVRNVIAATTDANQKAFEPRETATLYQNSSSNIQPIKFELGKLLGNIREVLIAKEYRTENPFQILLDPPGVEGLKKNDPETWELIEKACDASGLPSREALLKQTPGTQQRIGRGA